MAGRVRISSAVPRAVCLGAVTDSGGGFHPMPGLQALGVGGQAAALAVLHAVSLVRGGQEPVHLDVAVQEAAAFCSVQQEAAHKLFECGGAAGASRYSAPSGYFNCTRWGNLDHGA